ncbi:MAG: hypothetical protein Q7R81_03800 [Candidatus Peregrinibacteria bacterium]|nr:hypothetical protein [Candidatus Peregrinibacteria bacterium]
MTRTHQWLLPPVLFFGGSFTLHLLWENLQAPLYEGFDSFPQHFWICFKATWGDLLFMLTIYAALAIVHRDPFWIADRSTYAHPATWIITLLIGVLLAVSFELWAVHIDHRWQYTEAMPLIPILQIGLTPVLQMAVIPLLTLFLTSRFPTRP